METEKPVLASPAFDARRWLGLIIAALLIAETSLAFIVALVRGVLLPLMSRGLGGENASPFSLGTQDLNWPDLFASVLELCLAVIAALLIFAWSHRKRTATVPRPAYYNQVSSTIAPPRDMRPSVPTVLPPPEPQAPDPVASLPIMVPVVTPAPPEQKDERLTEVGDVTPPVQWLAATEARSSSAPEPATPPAQPLTPRLQPETVRVAEFRSPEPAQNTPEAPRSADPQPVPPPIEASLVPHQQPSPVSAAAPPKPRKTKPPKEVYYNIVGERITPEDEDEG